MAETRTLRFDPEYTNRNTGKLAPFSRVLTGRKVGQQICHGREPIVEGHQILLHLLFVHEIFGIRLQRGPAPQGISYSALRAHTQLPHVRTRL